MRRTQAFAVICSVLVLAMAFAPAMVMDEEDDSEAAGFVAGFIVGTIVGAFVTYCLLDAPSDDDSAVMVDSLKQALAGSEIGKVELAANSVMRLACTVMPSDSDMMFFTQNYWDQAMEYQVYENWTKSNIGKYDKFCKELLAGTGLLAAENNYLTVWANSLGYAMSHILEQSKYWNSDLSYADKLSISYTWDGKTVTATNGSTTDKLAFALAQRITATKDVLVYIDPSNDGDNFSSISKIIYLYDTSASKTIQNQDTGATFTLSVGENDVSSLPKGVYKLPAGASYVGPMLSVIGDLSAHVEGVVVLKSGSDFYTVSPESNSSVNIVSSDGEEWISNSLDVMIKAGSQTKTVALLSEAHNLTYFWDDMVQTFNKIADNTYSTGKATWRIFDEVEESSPYVHPSSLPVNKIGQTLSSAEKVNQTINMMAQLKDYYTKHQSNLENIEFNYNDEGLGLICYGDLYLNGNLWIEGAVFTPYLYSSDQHLEIGINEISGKGSIVIWDTVDSFSDWDRTMRLSAKHYPVDTNCSLDLKEMVSDGKEVQSIDITRQTVKMHDGNEIDDPTPAPMPKVFNASHLWAIILIEAGLILILLGRITGITVLSFAGVVVLLIGIIIPQAVSSLILGTFTLGDLKPFGWI